MMSGPVEQGRYVAPGALRNPVPSDRRMFTATFEASLAAYSPIDNFVGEDGFNLSAKVHHLTVRNAR
jgi:hypothetical protein